MMMMIMNNNGDERDEERKTKGEKKQDVHMSRWELIMWAQQ